MSEGLAAALSGPGHGVPSGLNQRLGLILVAIVALSPLPLGSNRPFFWAFWAAVVGCVALAFTVALYVNKRAPVASFPGTQLAATLLVVQLLYLAVQQLPVGQIWGPIRIPSRDGIDLAAATLSVAPGETWFAFQRAVTYALLFFLLFQVCAKQRLAARYLDTFLAVITIYALYGLFALTALGDTILFFEKWAYSGSATGPFINRNSFATYLAFGAVIGTVTTVSEYAKRRSTDAAQNHRSLGGVMRVPWVRGVCTATILAALFASQSRMGVAVGVLGAALAGTWALAKGNGSKPLLVVAALGVVATLGILSWLYGAGLGQRLGTLEHSSEMRLALYRQILEMIAARPWLGYGGGTFELAYPLFHLPPVDVEFRWDRAHSTYLSLWSDYGVVFGSIPMLVALLLFVKAVQLVHALGGSDWEAPLVAATAMVVGALHSLVDFSLEIEANALTLAALVAMGLAQYQVLRRRSAQAVAA